jgi:hypothetical protein
MSDVSNQAIEYSMGQGGFQLVTATTLTTGPFVAITTIAPTTFTSITGGNISGSWSTATIPAGITLPGPIESFQISSGQVVAFNGVIQS